MTLTYQNLHFTSLKANLSHSAGEILLNYVPKILCETTYELRHVKIDVLSRSCKI